MNFGGRNVMKSEQDLTCVSIRIQRMCVTDLDRANSVGNRN